MMICLTTSGQQRTHSWHLTVLGASIKSSHTPKWLTGKKSLKTGEVRDRGTNTRKKKERHLKLIDYCA